MAERIASYRPRSVLEVGCGYGKQIRALRERLDVPVVGLDFSPTQLGTARRYLRGIGDVTLVLGSGDRLPFEDGAFDLVMTSAVILHNPPTVAETIRSEVLRVSARWTAHNEDLDWSYNRYGYNTAEWYGQREIPLAECGPIPVEPDGPPSQFCVAEPWRL
jgi:SAM-dependent methyltransferase